MHAKRLQPEFLILIKRNIAYYQRSKNLTHRKAAQHVADLQEKGCLMTAKQLDERITHDG